MTEPHNSRAVTGTPSKMGVSTTGVSECTPKRTPKNLGTDGIFWDVLRVKISSEASNGKAYGINWDVLERRDGAQRLSLIFVLTY